MKNILLICPSDNLIERDKELYPSGALVLMGTMAHNLGHNVKIIHTVTDRVGHEKLRNIVSAFRPDIVGVTMNTFQTKSAKEITRVVKETDKNALIVIGGPHPSSLKLKTFDYFPYVDVVVFGEGEHTFLEIVEGKNFKEIKGICYRDRIEGPKMTEPRPLAENLDHIPLSNLDLVGFSKDKFIGADPVAARPDMYIMASRGCPFQCIYCNKSIWGMRARFRKPELMIEEIKWLHGKYGVREIFFQDDTFNLNREWAENIFNLIIDNGLNKDIVYKTQFRANKQLVDRELLELAKRAGFWLIFYGVESGNQQILNRMKKGLTIEELKRAFKLTHSVGLKTIASFIIGLPGETKETIKDTYNLWKELK
ncbi:B12-binding domain-containing radical SAM protein, partial [Patescibacteria group bacterium]|nr:B12-binding domain-containing radical SAM protein [Patescibacteria group bacterium]